MFNRLIDSAVFLALVSAYLFAANTAYDNAYLNAYGLNEEILERSFSQVIYNGFVQMLQPISALIFISFLMILFIPEAFFASGRGRNNNAEANWVKRFVVGASFLVLWLMCFYSLVQQETAGRETGLKEIKVLKDAQDLINVKIDGEPHKLVLITCGARNCAGIDKYSYTVHYFPQQSFSYKLNIDK